MGTVQTNDKCDLRRYNPTQLDVYPLVRSNGEIIIATTIPIIGKVADDVIHEYIEMVNYDGAEKRLQLTVPRLFTKNLKKLTTGCICKCILCMWWSFPLAKTEQPLEAHARLF